MTTDDYLDALDSRLREISALIVASVIHREIDENTGIGFLKGQITFVDGSKLDFTEQLPTERAKFRLHYMDSLDNMIARWDSAPHHKELGTFPFHKHTSQGVKAHAPITLVQALDEIVKMLQM